MHDNAPETLDKFVESLDSQIWHVLYAIPGWDIQRRIELRLMEPSPVVAGRTSRLCLLSFEFLPISRFTVSSPSHKEYI